MDSWLSTFYARFLPDSIGNCNRTSIQYYHEQDNVWIGMLTTGCLNRNKDIRIDIRIMTPTGGGRMLRNKDLETDEINVASRPTQMEHTPRQERPVPQTASAVFRIAPEGIRTALATLLPLVIGQLTGHNAIGLMIGLGGLYVSIADKEGATIRTLWIAIIGVAIAAIGGTVIGLSGPLSIATMFIVAFWGGLLGVYGVIPGHLGFVFALVFGVMLGLPAPAPMGLERAFELSLGGLWAISLTRMMSPHLTTRCRERRPLRLPKSSAPFAIFLRLLLLADLRLHKIHRNFTFRSEVFQHACRLGLISALAVALYKILHLEHGAWLTVTVLVIVKPDYISTRQRATERVLGTLFGGLLALILAATVKNLIVNDLILLALSTLAYSHQRHNYGLFVVFLTPFIVLMLNTATPGGPHLALLRIGNTLLGGALALAGAYLLRPRHTGAT